MKIELKILKKDILIDNYFDYDNCPITKALHRAGYKHLFDAGEIMNSSEGVVLAGNNKEYRELLKKLYGMYNSFMKDEKDKFCLEGIGKVPSIPVKTFVHVLNIPDKFFIKKTVKEITKDEIKKNLNKSISQ